MPIVVQGQARPARAATDSCDWIDSTQDMNAFAGLAAGWLKDATRAVDPLAWDPPRRVVLRAARGTIVLRRTKRAILAAVLDPGLRPEELRLPMDAAATRLERSTRRSSAAEVGSAHESAQPNPPGPIPGAQTFPAPPVGTEENHMTQNDVPEKSGGR